MLRSCRKLEASQTELLNAGERSEGLISAFGLGAGVMTVILAVRACWYLVFVLFENLLSRIGELGIYCLLRVRFE